MIAAMRALWTEDEPTHSGDFFSFERAISRPRPVQIGGVPIHIGGHSKAAARRAGRMAYQPLGLRGDELARKLDIVHATAADAGRDPSTIELSLSGLVESTAPDDVKRAEDAGATRLVMSTQWGTGPSCATRCRALPTSSSTFEATSHRNCR